LVASIEALGGRAVGLTGIDGVPFEGSKLSKRTEPMVKVRELAYAVMEAVLERRCSLDVHKGRQAKLDASGR
jgi:hypothetical protein